VKTGGTRWRARAAACAAAIAATVTAACGGSGLPSAPSLSASASAAASHAAAGDSATPARPAASAAAGTAAAGSGATACVTHALDGLTLAQRVGQLFLVGVDGNADSPALTKAEKSYHFGSLLLNKTGAGTAALGERTTGLQALAVASDDGIRFFVAANQEGGEIQQLAGPGFAVMPSELDQGTWSDSRLRTAASTWGTDLRAAGVNLDLAPVVDVVPKGTAAGNAPIGALDREFGSDPAGNGAHGTAFIQGMAGAGVMTVAKHFPGLGRVTGNTDFTADVTDDVTTASDPDLGSFRTVIGAGVPMVMVALATYTKIDPGQLAVFSPTVMHLLRSDFGFPGVIVSDDLGEAAAVHAVPSGQRAVRFVSAGGDLVTSQSLAPAEQMAAAVLAKASADTAFAALVNSAARLVLAAKQVAGLLPC
jgi:beta-N-acetylhexosaminidase